MIFFSVVDRTQYEGKKKTQHAADEVKGSFSHHLGKSYTGCHCKQTKDEFLRSPP